MAVISKKDVDLGNVTLDKIRDFFGLNLSTDPSENLDRVLYSAKLELTLLFSAFRKVVDPEKNFDNEELRILIEAVFIEEIETSSRKTDKNIVDFEISTDIRPDACGNDILHVSLWIQFKDFNTREKPVQGNTERTNSTWPYWFGGGFPIG